MNKLYTLVIIIVSSFYILATNPVFAGNWFNTASGDVHVVGDLSPLVPTPSFFTYADPIRGDSGIVTYSGTASGLGANSGSETFGATGIIDVGVGSAAIDRVISPNTATDTIGYGFDYYYGKLQSKMLPPLNTTNLGCSIIQLKPPTGPAAGDIFLINGNLNFNAVGCNLVIDRSFILLVDGDVDIRLRGISLDPDVYFSIITSGTITIQPEVGASGSSIQGIYIADQTIVTVAGVTNQFLLGGSFIAHNGADFNRTAGAVTVPAEQLLYAPRHMISALRDIKRVRVTKWDNIDP